MTGPVLQPASPEIEERLVASILEMPHLFPEVSDMLKAEAFYDPKPRMVWSAILRCAEKGRTITDIDVFDAIRSQMGADRWLREGPDVETYLRSLSQVITSPHVAKDARRIIGRYARRKMIAVARQIAAEGLADETDDEAFLTEAQGMLTTAATEIDVGGADTCQRLGEIVRDHFEDMRAMSAENRTGGVSTGLASLDALIGSYRETKVIIVGARPGMGKSAYMTMAAVEAAQDRTHPELTASIIFSAEMAKRQVAIRMLASEARINNRLVQDGRMRDEQWAAATEAAAWLDQQPIWVDDRSAPTLAYVRAKIRRKNHELSRQKMAIDVEENGQWVKREMPVRVRMVIIDYIQLMTPPPEKANDTEAAQLTAIANGLKLIAKEERCTVIVLAQLNRDLEKRPNKRPVIADLRGSGGLEQAADTIMFLYRDEYYNRSSQAVGLCEIDVAKQRDGGTVGRTVVGFDKEYTRFRDLDPVQLDEAKRLCGFGERE